jgi:5'-nucleotidase
VLLLRPTIPPARICVPLMHDAPVALVDLGDTLVDCTPAWRVQLARLRMPEDRDGDESLNPLPAYLEERRQAVMSTPGFWRELPPRRSGMELLVLLRNMGFRVHVLTKGPYEPTHVWADKVAWCRVHLPRVPVIVTDDKTRIHGHVLVDDWLPYVERWQRQWPTGLAIVPAQPWNFEANRRARCIRDDGANRESIVAALAAIAMRRTNG